MVKLKYKPGTRLKVLTNKNGNFNKGDIITVILSKKYGSHYYKFDTDLKINSDPGWVRKWIEDPKKFALAKIDNWRKQIEG